MNITVHGITYNVTTGADLFRLLAALQTLQCLQRAA
jgi:hypothetical protein